MSDAAPVPDSPPEQPEATTHESDPGLLADPVVRIMSYVLLGLVILFLATVVSVFGTGIVAPTGPRSVAERKLMQASEQVRAGAKGEEWAPYIDALIVAGDLPAARVALSQARASATATASTSLLDLSEARIYKADEQYEDAVKAADNAMKGFQAQYDARIAKGGKIAATAKVNGQGDGYLNAALVKASSLVALGRHKDAIALYDIYLKRNFTAADIFIDRGNAKIAIKDNAGAAKDFKEALRFMPDDEAAKAGLKKIGVAE